MNLKEVLEHFEVKSGPNGESGYYECFCPAHKDTHPSLLIKAGESGVQVKCQRNCRTEDVLAAVGLKMSDLFYEPRKGVTKPTAPKIFSPKPAELPKAKKPEEAVKRVVDRVYTYTDEQGKTVFEVVRYKPKDFRQRVPDASQRGGYRWSIKGVRPVIYNLPHVLAAIAAGEAIFVVEGEKDADNLALIGLTGTTCAMGACKWHKEHSEFLRSADVYIIPDNDEPGEQHAQKVAQQLFGIARSIRILHIKDVCPELPAKGDVSDMMQLLGKSETRRLLDKLMTETPEETAPEVSQYERAVELYDDVPGYCIIDGGICAMGKESVRKLSTFVALPTNIITKDDGVNIEKYFGISGWTKTGHPLPPVTVRAEEFGGMGWVLKNWDFAANVMPGNTIKEQLRYVMTEVGNQSAVRETVYTHVGWRKIGGKWAYLHPGGAIGAEGVRVELESALSRYSFDNDLPDDRTVTMALAHNFRDAMALHVSVPLMGIAFLAPLREFLAQAGHTPRFAMWIKGSSGVRKSTATALTLSFFGQFGYSDPLPASFHDTSNSIRRKAFVLKDSLLCVDDYHPETSMQERRKMESLVQSLSRAYGNGDDRGRMTAERKLEGSTPSRGLAIMSGEQTPDIGPSGVARYYIISVEKDDIAITPELEVMQGLAKRGYLRKAMSEYIEWLSRRADHLASELPEAYVRLRAQAMKASTGAHGRSAEAVAHVMLGYEMMLRYMVDIGAAQPEQVEEEIRQAWDVVMDNSRRQTEEAKEDRPVAMFLSAVLELLASKQATVRDLTMTDSGATPPSTIGYCDAQYYYLLPDVAYSRVARLYSDQGVTFPLGKRALFKQLKDEGILMCDSATNKTTKPKRIGSNVLRLLWLDRVRVDKLSGKVVKAEEEQLSIVEAQDDADNPFL